MTRTTRLFVSAAVAFTVAFPSLAHAQRSRGGSEPSGSASSGGSSGGGGGNSGSGGSSEPSRPSGDAPRTGFAVPRNQATPPPMPSADRGRPSDSGRTGVAQPSERNGANGAVRGPERFNDPSYPGRPRDENNPTTGYAMRRTEPLRPGVVIGGRDIYYPWYGSGMNWYYAPYGYYPYNSSRWIWGRYGMWYDPFAPFGYYGGAYSGMSYSNGYGYGYGYDSPRSQDLDSNGSIRVRVSPRDAKVYLDGTMMGSVDDFDGLRDHLAAPAGDHEIEIRADGYLPLKLPVTVQEDKTVTVRGTLKKN